MFFILVAVNGHGIQQRIITGGFMNRQFVRGLALEALVLFGGLALAQQASLIPPAPTPNQPSGSLDRTVESSSSASANRESSFLASWSERVHDTLSQQPAWPVPLVTASSGLVECFRSDFVRQVTPAGTDTWIYGNSKGANLVPWYNTEFDAAVPPYIQHNSAAQDGFGDFSMLLKYRLAAGNASHGNYSFSASLGATLPTGSYKNGSMDATISPTVYAGKGFGRFDVQSSLGAVLPMSDTLKLGRVVLWNTVAQYHLGKLFWPEIEDNTSFFSDGLRDGRVQNFITPGLMIAKVKFKRDSPGRRALVFGGGMQIATSHFHTYNHGLVLTVRTLF
jgi:hypothetical protein